MLLHGGVDTVGRLDRVLLSGVDYLDLHALERFLRVACPVHEFRLSGGDSGKLLLMMLLAIGVSGVMLRCEVDGDVWGAAHATVHATVLTPNLGVAGGRLAPCHCLSIFDAAAETVKVAFAKHYFFARLL